MNHDELFRQALRRQNDRATEMKMPADMEQRVMNRIKPRNRSHHWLYAVSVGAVAASILLLLKIHYIDKNTVPKEETVAAQPTIQRNSLAKDREKPTIGQGQINDAEPGPNLSPLNNQSPVVAGKKPADIQKTAANHGFAIKNPSAFKVKTAPAVTTDQLSEYIARLEAEMEAVDDSVRAAQLEKIIAADARLQQLVSRIVKDETEQAMRELQKDSTANYINF